MRSFFALVGLTAIVLAGCGGDDNGSNDSAASTPAATTQTATSTAAAPSRDLTFKATEYAFSPSTTTAKAGKVKLTMVNDGAMEHELVVLKTDTPADQLPVSNGRVSEKDSVGEISETAAGKTASTTLDLKPGTYVYVCNIPGHYQAGMRGTLTVK